MPKRIPYIGSQMCLMGERTSVGHNRHDRHSTIVFVLESRSFTIRKIKTKSVVQIYAITYWKKKHSNDTHI